MFELTKQEYRTLRYHFGTLKRGTHSKYLPYAFTDYGILMLSSILNSERAVQVNIQIMRTFTKLRDMLASYKELKQKIEDMEGKYDYQFKVVFSARGGSAFGGKAIKELLGSPKKPRDPLDFTRGDDI